MKESQSNRALIRKFARYLLPYIRHEVTLFILMIVASTGSLATPYILKIIIDDIFPKGDYRGLIAILTILVGIYLIRILSAVFTEILYTRISQHIIADIRADMLRNILSRPVHFFRASKQGDILYTVMSDVQNIQNAISSLVLNFSSDILTVLGIVIMMGILDVKLTLISLLILPFIIFSIRKFTPHLQHRFRVVQELQEVLNNFFIEKLRNIRVVKSYNTTSYEIESLDTLQNKTIQQSVSSAKVSALNSNITLFFIAIGPVIVLLYGGRHVFSGTLTVGALIAFIQYLSRLYSPALNIMNNYNNFAKALVSMERVEKYIGVNEIKIEKTKDIPAFNKISFNKVSLQVNDHTILHPVDLHFEKGKVYGIIGPSGSGKSTISNLLCGFVNPTEGEILLDNTNAIHNYNNWSDRLGLIEKENQLFNQSILENIRYGSFDATEEHVIKASNDAAFNTVVQQLPDGLQTMINETGTTLSDGQKQRISIARALLRKADVIIFDEATAALDIQLEKEILETMKYAYQDTIIIVITHRLHTLPSLDYVYAIEDGRVVKEGLPAQFVS